MKEDLSITKKPKHKTGIFVLAAGITAVILGSVLIVRAMDSREPQEQTVGLFTENDKERETEKLTEPEQNKETEEVTERTEPQTLEGQLTDEYMLRYGGVDIAGSDKKGTVYFRELMGAGGGTSELSLWSDGKMIWTSDEHMAVSTAHVGQTSYYAVDADGKKCFMEYTPYVGQGTGTSYYEIFTVDMNGKEKIIDKGCVGFVLMKKSSGDGYFPIGDIAGFADKIRGYIDGGSLLVSTVNGIFEYDNTYDKDNALFPYLKFIYPWVYEQAASQNLDLSRYASLEEALAELEKGLRVMPEDWDAQIDIMIGQINDLK